MPKPIIQVENLSKMYQIGAKESYYSLRDSITDMFKLKKGRRKKDDFWALKDINFNITQGEAIGIIGRNGAGKSTLLKILSQITPPTTGKITMRGRVASLLEVGTGFHPELTGRENIYLNGAILGMTRLEIKSKFDEIVAFSEIEKFLNTPVKRYSSGMYVRLAFAVAAHLEPEILVVDEVLAVGDIAFQKKCLGKMDEVAKKSGRTVIFVSHNMAAIKQLCPKSILLDKGELVLSGVTDKVMQAYLSKLDSESSEPEKKLKEDKSKEFQVLSVSITDSKGRIRKNFECDEPVCIHLNCVSRKEVAGLYGYLSLAKEGVEILVSDTYDIPSSSLNSLAPAKYGIDIEIPARSISPGKYSVNLSFTSAQAFSDFFIDSPGEVCQFEIEDNTTSRGNRRDGYFSTLLEWKVNKNA